MVAGSRQAMSLSDRPVGDDRVAEVTGADLPDIDDELLPQRLVETIGLAHRGDLLRRRVLAGKRRRRIVRQHAQHDEGENQQPEQRREASTSRRRTKRAISFRQRTWCGNPRPIRSA